MEELLLSMLGNIKEIEKFSGDYVSIVWRTKSLQAENLDAIERYGLEIQHSSNPKKKI